MIDQILTGAEGAFLAAGYDLATMDLVARHAGVARASVYNHFKSKEELFLAVMRRGIAGFVDRAIGGEDMAQPPIERIRTVAVDFLHAAIQPDSIEMYRTVLSHGGRFPELSDTLYTHGLMRIEEKFASLATLAGRDSIADPAAFAETLLSQLMGGYFGRRLLGIGGHPADDSPESYVDRAIASLRLPLPDDVPNASSRA